MAVMAAGSNRGFLTPATRTWWLMDFSISDGDRDLRCALVMTRDASGAGIRYCRCSNRVVRPQRTRLRKLAQSWSKLRMVCSSAKTSRRCRWALSMHTRMRCFLRTSAFCVTVRLSGPPRALATGLAALRSEAMLYRGPRPRPGHRHGREGQRPYQ